MGRSSKAQDSTATGKFGVGFNGTYHLSDLVSFISGDFFVVMDPHARHLLGKEDRQRAFARRWKLSFIAENAPSHLDEFMLGP